MGTPMIFNWLIERFVRFCNLEYLKLGSQAHPMKSEGPGWGGKTAFSAFEDRSVAVPTPNIHGSDRSPVCSIRAVGLDRR